MNLKTILVLVLLSQTATALNYTRLPELNLTIGTPPYGTIWDYNLDRSLTATEPPQEVNQSDGSGVRDAWVKILALDKLILDSETNSSYASNQGKVLTKYGFTPRCPPSYYCWPDCYGIRYELAGYSEEYSLYANGILQGTYAIQDYAIPENSSTLELEATLEIEVRCRKYHLRWVLDENNQPEYCTEEYDGIETYKANFADKKTYGLIGLKPQANLTFSRLAQDVSETSKGRLAIRTASPYSDAIFIIGDNKLEFSGNAYDIDYYLPDYNLLRISTYSLPRITDYSLFSELSRTRNNQTGVIITTLDFTLTYDETEAMLESRNCKLAIKDLFNKEYILDKLCETDWKQTTLNASTSGLLFNDGEQVNVSAVLAFNGIPLEGRKLILRYAGVEYEEYTNSEGAASFTIQAEYPENKIEVEYSSEGEYLGSSKTLLIATSNSGAMTLVTGILPTLLLLLVTAYGFYKMVKRWGW
jgi:hypothetical protein